MADDDPLFYGMVNRQKRAQSYFQPGPFSEMLSIADVRRACPESEVRLVCMMVCIKLLRMNLQ